MSSLPVKGESVLYSKYPKEQDVWQNTFPWHSASVCRRHCRAHYWAAKPVESTQQKPRHICSCDWRRPGIFHQQRQRQYSVSQITILRQGPCLAQIPVKEARGNISWCFNLLFVPKFGFFNVTSFGFFLEYLYWWGQSFPPLVISFFHSVSFPFSTYISELSQAYLRVLSAHRPCQELNMETI